MVVDCENVDPYKLSATLRGLSKDSLSKISSIILFDDVHASSGWDLLQQFTSIPVDGNTERKNPLPHLTPWLHRQLQVK